MQLIMIKLLISLKGGDVEMILGLGYLTSSYERGNERRRLRMGDLGQKPSKLFNPQIFHWFYWLDQWVNIF